MTKNTIYTIGIRVNFANDVTDLNGTNFGQLTGFVYKNSIADYDIANPFLSVA